ncbi:MAG: PD-(D/E)XK nuclease family protein [Vicinamibacterales bacterium]
MTFTALTQIERCPRQWALTNSTYPQMWARDGYPPRLNVTGLEGQVLHRSVEVIVRALTDAGCGSIDQPSAFEVMKGLGGYSVVINDAISRVLRESAENPRAFRIIEVAERRLRSRAQEIRAEVQTMVSRLSLAARGVPRRQLMTGAYEGGALSAGAFSEVALSVLELRWKGRVDLLVIDADRCEITDFKTSKEDPAHAFQLRLYALLWSLDRVKNPNARAATRLVLAYLGRDQEVSAPTAGHLAQLRGEVAARSDAARGAIESQPPEARPTRDHCGVCAVRQLCSDYWECPSAETTNTEDRRWIDLQVTIERQHGPSSWDAAIERAPMYAPRSRKVLIRTAGDVTFRQGTRLRILDACLNEPDDEDPNGQREPDTVIAMLNASSEVYANTVP